MPFDPQSRDRSEGGAGRFAQNAYASRGKWNGRACGSKESWREEETVSSKSRKDQIEELLALDPDDSFLRYGLAMEHTSAGHDEEAVKVFTELLARDPDYVAGYLQAGRACMRLGQDEQAKEVLRKGVEVARRKGDEHAAGEMAGFLAEIQ
jgi:tetratricopeptide (TPR) repeat protein